MTFDITSMTMILNVRTGMNEECLVDVSFFSPTVTLVESSTAADILEDNVFPFCDRERKFQILC